MAPLDLWLPPRPAIIRPAHHEASFLPGMFPAGAMAAAPATIEPPMARFVGQYPYTFGTNGTGATVTAPIADLQFPADGDRQLVVFVHYFFIFIEGITIAGVPVLRVRQSQAGFTDAFTAFNASTSNFNIVLTGSTWDATGENGRIEVYEVTKARNMRECNRSGTPRFEELANPSIGLDMPAGGLALAAVGCGNWDSPGDTGAISWTGLTENAEALTSVPRPYRVSSASLLLPAAR